MKKCKSCQTEIDPKATKCPHCRADQRGWFKRHPIITGILVIFVLFILVKPSGNSNNSINSTTSNDEINSSSKSETTESSASSESPVPAEYKSALIKATMYANTMHMSKKGVYDQLVSAYGEKFSPEAAQYAIENVKTDWNANALAKAKTYQNTMSMSPAAIRDQLVSDFGEKFTQEEAEYAIQHLN